MCGKKSGKQFSDQYNEEIDEKYFRPSEVSILLGDATKAKNKLNWIPNTDFKALVKLMLDSEKEEYVK